MFDLRNRRVSHNELYDIYFSRKQRAKCGPTADRLSCRISTKMDSQPCGGTIPNKPPQCVYSQLYFRIVGNGQVKILLSKTALNQRAYASLCFASSGLARRRHTHAGHLGRDWRYISASAKVMITANSVTQTYVPIDTERWIILYK